MADPVVEEPQPEPEAPPKKRRWWLIATVAAVLVLGGGGGAAWYFLGGEPAAEATKDVKGKPGKKKVPAAEPVYVSLDPPFVVNFESNGLVRFLQVTVQAMSRDPAMVDLIKRHDPVIRNGLLMLFSGQDYETLSTRDGKEQLRKAALAEIRKAIAAEGGKAERIEAVYFTSFVMQ
jgi:flagellar FliL protein